MRICRYIVSNHLFTIHYSLFTLPSKKGDAPYGGICSKFRTIVTYFGLRPLAPSDEGAGKTPVLTEGETDAKNLVTVIFSNFLIYNPPEFAYGKPTPLYTKGARRGEQSARINHTTAPVFRLRPCLPLTMGESQIFANLARVLRRNNAAKLGGRENTIPHHCNVFCGQALGCSVGVGAHDDPFLKNCTAAKRSIYIAVFVENPSAEISDFMGRRRRRSLWWGWSSMRIPRR